MRVVGEGKPAPPWMLLRIALETGPHHAAADEDRLAGLKLTSVDAYRHFLTSIFGFEAAVERVASSIVGEHSELARDHCKAQHLRADLGRFGLDDYDLELLPRCSPAIRTSADAIGWMFVVVRNRLVAGQLRRHLTRVLGGAIGGATSYLDACSDKTGLRLRQFGDQLSTAAANATSAREIVAAAHNAFRAQRQWYASVPPPPAVPRRGQVLVSSHADMVDVKPAAP